MKHRPRTSALGATLILMYIDATESAARLAEIADSWAAQTSYGCGIWVWYRASCEPWATECKSCAPSYDGIAIYCRLVLTVSSNAGNGF